MPFETVKGPFTRVRLVIFDELLIDLRALPLEFGRAAKHHKAVKCLGSVGITAEVFSSKSIPV